MKIDLTTKPEIIEMESRPFLYLEKIGPFMVQAPKAWQEFWEITNDITKALSIKAMAGLSRTDESKSGDERFIYQAGLFLNNSPNVVPNGLKLRVHPGGKYARFMLTGSYSQLPHGFSQAIAILERQGISVRNEFCAEIYLNTPQDTEEKNLKTEILVPIN
jgi:DNA gyrase inhibitor GyrI